jgi:hypothetical protein
VGAITKRLRPATRGILGSVFGFSTGLATGLSVCGALCLWGFVSVGLCVCGALCLWGFVWNYLQNLARLLDLTGFQGLAK